MNIRIASLTAITGLIFCPRCLCMQSLLPSFQNLGTALVNVIGAAAAMWSMASGYIPTEEIPLLNRNKECYDAFLQQLATVEGKVSPTGKTAIFA